MTTYKLVPVAPTQGMLLAGAEGDPKLADHAAWVRGKMVEAAPEVKAEPVAWVVVVDTYEGPYNFHGKELLPTGLHDLYLHPPSENEPAAIKDSLTAHVTEPVAIAIENQDARFAIDGAIAFGYQATGHPPSGHWLSEYWQLGRKLKAHEQTENLAEALRNVLNTSEAYARAEMSYQNARENFSDDSYERKAHERAMLNANKAEANARAALAEYEAQKGGA